MRERSARRLALAAGVVLAALIVAAPLWKQQLAPLVRGSGGAHSHETRARVAGARAGDLAAAPLLARLLSIAQRVANLSALVPGH